MNIIASGIHCIKQGFFISDEAEDEGDYDEEEEEEEDHISAAKLMGHTGRATGPNPPFGSTQQYWSPCENAFLLLIRKIHQVNVIVYQKRSAE